MKESPPHPYVAEGYFHKRVQPYVLYVHKHILTHGRVPLGSRQSGSSFTSVLLIKTTKDSFYQMEAELHNRIPG